MGDTEDLKYINVVSTTVSPPYPCYVIKCARNECQLNIWHFVPFLTVMFLAMNSGTSSFVGLIRT